MIICHVCKTECEDGAELCPVCGAVLRDVSKEIAAKTEEEKVIKNPTVLATLEDVVSAEIFKDILKENGIPFACDSAEGDGAMQVTFGGGFITEDIYVDESDFEAADKLYSEFLESEAEFNGEFFFEDEETELDEVGETADAE